MIPTFYHSGEIGDIIYGLKAISRLPLSNLYLHNNLLLDWSNIPFAHPNKRIDFRQFLFLKPLLERQPYLKNVVFGTPQQIDYNLNYFRSNIFTKIDLNFGDLFLDICNFTIDKNDAHTPWLFCNKIKEYPITVIRVSRRTHNMFPWKRIVEKYHKDIIFLGTLSEYCEFVEFTGKLVAWKDYTNLLSICEIINGASLHIGNCTSMSVCAEALKKPIIFEHEHISSEIRYTTHQFYRQNRINVDPDITNNDFVMEKINTFLGY